jgi:hypothetical protein
MLEVKASNEDVLVFCGLAAAWMVVWFVFGFAVDKVFITRMTMPDKYREIAVNKAVALMHAVFATAHAWYYHGYFLDEVPSQRYHCIESTWGTWRRVYPAGFVGYLVLDFVMECRKKKADPLMLVHHAIFAAVACVSMLYGKGCLQYTVTLMSEASTVVWVARWFLIATEQPQKLIKASELLFAFLFFVLRVIFFGHGTWVSLTEDADVFADASAWQFVPAIYILGYAMQVWWMYEIILVAVKPPRKAKEPEKPNKAQ